MEIHLDFETRSIVDLTETGIDVYAKHPSTQIMCIGWAVDDGDPDLIRQNTDVAACKNLMAHVAQGATVVAHNAVFELGIWNEILAKRRGWPVLRPENTRCTMAMALAMGLPGKLEKAAPALGLQQNKDLEGHRVMLQLCKPRPDGSWWTPETHPDKFAKLYDYCKQDVRTEQALFKRLLPLSPYEQAIWELDYKINQRGVMIDAEAARAAIAVADLERKILDENMRLVSDNRVATCNATGQLADFIRSHGIETPGVAKADVLDLLERESELPEVVVELLKLRQMGAKSSTKKLDAMIKGLSADDRVRFIHQYSAAHTRRWGGRRVQFQNIPRPKMKRDQIEEVFEILDAVE